MKDISEFHRDKTNKNGYNYWCKQCKRDNDKAWRDSHKELQKVRHDRYYKGKGYQTTVKRLYGADVNYDNMYAKQKGRCDICGVHQSELKKRLHVDHDDKTGFVRSLLCHSCNVGLGHFRHCKDLLHKAINYLKRYESV